MSLAEKYRPRSFSELLDQEHIKQSLEVLTKAVKAGERDMPHMLFIGPAGTGKTSMAYVIASELGWDIVEFNASDERGIEVIRGKIKHLAFASGRRIILLDEADALTEDAQQALRRIMERAQKRYGSRFILTANYESKIIQPIKSRCAIYRFQPLPRELVVKRLVEILRSEGVRVSKENINEVREAIRIIVDVSAGDLRKALNMLEEVVASRTKFTPEAVKSLVAPGLADVSLQKAMEGDLREAVRTLEDLIINNRLDLELTLRSYYDAIKKLPDPVVRARAWMELARAEHAIREGASPLIQLTGFLSLVWFQSRGGQSVPG